MTTGYSAVLLPQLQSNATSDIRISDQTATWIASTAVIPMILGGWIGGIVMTRYGRRGAHLIMAVPFVVGWATIGFAHNLPLLLLGRFITGACCGVLRPPSSVMISEISAPKYRGLLLVGISLAIAIGILISHVLGTFFHWQTTARISCIFPVICFCILSQVPESPSWLIAKGRLSDAKKSFQWYRGRDESANIEFQDLMDKQMTNYDSTKPKERWEQLRKEVTEPSFWKPLLIILTFFLVMQFSGVNAVTFYSVNLMQKTLGVGGMDKHHATILIDSVRLSMAIVACGLLGKLSRRALALFSAIGTSTSLFCLTIYLHLSSRGLIPTVPILPLILLISYICCITVGLVPLPWCMTAELLPLKSRGIGTGIVAAFNFGTFFMVVQSGPTLLSNLGAEGAFLIYGSVAFVGIFFIYFFLPETRNKTLQQIEDSFKAHGSRSIPVTMTEEEEDFSGENRI